MSHFDEITALLYVEGQLDSTQSSAVDVHAAECADCRAIIRALQQESLLLGNSLQEDAEPLPARLRTAPWEQSLPPAVQESHHPSHHWSLWAWLLGFAVTAAACFTAWTDVISPWADQLDQTGIQSSSLLIRFFMTSAFWKGWTTVLNTSLYAVFTVISVSLIGIVALALRRDQWRKAANVAMVLGGVAVLFGLPAPANAAEIRRGNDVDVPSGETIHNDLIAAGQSVRIDGTVDGDLITFSQNVTVTGHVTGDVIAFGDAIRIDGPVDGNVRCFCNTLTLDSTIGKNLSAFAAHVELNPSATVTGGAMAFAGSFLVDGKVGRDLLFFVGHTTLNGSVGGDIRLRQASGPSNGFVIGPTAQVAGRLHVISDRQPEISASAKLGRPLEFELVTPAQRQGGRAAGRFAGIYLIRQAVSYGVAFLMGLLLISLFPGLFPAVATATRRVGVSIGVGTLIMLVGLPLLLFSILLLIAGAGPGFAALMLYFPVLYAAPLFVGAWVGQAFASKWARSASLLGQLAIGLLIVRVLGMIPFLGIFVWIAVYLWGTGAIFVALWNRTRPTPSVAPATA